jgi:hypothetical protein
MNFGKLLAHGKSIISGRGGAAYRENPHVYLPKFESVKNPFAKVGSPSAPSPATPVPAPAAPVKTTVVVDRPVSASPAPAMPPAKTAPAKPVARLTYPSLATQPSNWAAKLNPMTMFRGPSATTKNVTAVQTELSLDTVKVIENDLRDEEVEVVPLKSRPAKGKSGEPEESWDDMGAKIFGANAV